MSKNDPLLTAVGAVLREIGAASVQAPPVPTMVVAVSGGPDSICLLDALTRLARRPAKGQTRPALVLHVAHLHHGLRGLDADRDEAFVRKTAGRHGWPVTIGRIDARQRARQAKRSLQEAARLERYRFLAETADRVGATWIAVGHTATDQAETLLLRLLRGTGPAGLAGMPLAREGHIVRPLLRVTRDAVIDYLRRYKLAYRRDRSNRDRHYTRNRLRADLLPRLARDYNPSIVTALATTAMLMAEERHVVEELLAGIWREGLIATAPDRLLFDRTAFVRQPPAVQRWWLHRALRVLAAGAGRIGTRRSEVAPAGAASAIEEMLRRMRDGATGSLGVRGGIEVEFDRAQIRFTRRLATTAGVPAAPAANHNGG